MESFKLLRGYEESIEPLNDSSPSWMWAEEFYMRQIPNYRWVILTERCFGIRSFLNLFPDHLIIPVVSITSNNITHTFGNRNGGNGWGFDIVSDLLVIEYYSLIPI